VALTNLQCCDVVQAIHLHVEGVREQHPDVLSKQCGFKIEWVRAVGEFFGYILQKAAADHLRNRGHACKAVSAATQ